VGDAVVKLLFFWVGFCVGLRDALCDHLLIALLVAGIFAVGTLHAGRILEKLSAKRATHDVVKLLLHELVAIHLVNFFFLCTDGAFSPESQVQRSFAPVVLRYGGLVHGFNGDQGEDSTY